MTRRERLSTRLARLLILHLGEKGSWSTISDNAMSIDGSPASWFVTAQRAGNHLTLLETISSMDVSSRVVRYWLLEPSSDGNWNLAAAEKNHEQLDEEWINDELEEAIGRLEDPHSASTALEVPKARRLEYLVPAPNMGVWSRHLRSAAAFAFFVCAFFILLTVNSLQYHRMVRLVGDLNSAIGGSSMRQTQAIQFLSDRLESVDTELSQLGDEVMRERMAFEFSRKNTSMTIRNQADALPRTQYSRKRAYYYIADRIESSGSYGEIIFQLSRVPEDNAQAETLLAVDRANITPLSKYRVTVPGFAYPVRIDGGMADGRDFMISSGFGELRPSSIGTGGYLPHMAIDIINVKNILTVTPENSIVRFPGEPGNAVAAAAGEVLYTGYDSVYGWYLEIDHPLDDAIIEHYGKIERITSFYAHMAEDPGWDSGDKVEISEKIGTIGETGKATGPHLHFEVRIYRKSGEFTNRYGQFDRVNPFVPAED